MVYSPIFILGAQLRKGEKRGSSLKSDDSAKTGVAQEVTSANRNTETMVSQHLTVGTSEPVTRNIGQGAGSWTELPSGL